VTFYADDFEAPDHDFAAGTSLTGRMTPLGTAPWMAMAGVNPFIIHDNQGAIPNDGLDAGSFLTTPYTSRIMVEATILAFVVAIFIGEPEPSGYVGYVVVVRSDRLTLTDRFHSGGAIDGEWEGEVAPGDRVALAWTGDRALVFHNGVVVIEYAGGIAPSGHAGLYFAE
jgi:hypothetical protein